MNKKQIIENLNIQGFKKAYSLISGRIVNNRYLIKKKSITARKHYEKIIQNIKQNQKKTIRFAAYVIFDSTYGMDVVFRMMQKDENKWNPKIVVIPDISRGEQHKLDTYVKTKDFFVKKYGASYVLDGWDLAKDEYYDWTDQFDIVYYANPYDSMVHRYHSIEYASTKNVLPIYVSYGYDVGRYTTLERLKNPELNLMWKIFADTTYSYEDYKQYEIIKGENVVLAGYSKMDALKNNSSTEKKKKKILITSHHTVNFNILPLSNFLKYYKLILKLPALFPEIDFVFRPHPLLFTALINNGIWSDAKVARYLELLQKKGIEYSSGGDYLDLFSECDAMINDCGSFTVEWLYTGKPGCFLYNEKLKDEQLTNLMKESIKKHTIARSESDIIDFITDISKNDRKQEYKMDSWVKKNIAINYPNVSEYIFNEISII